jgi:hypothetical protein
MDTTIRRNATHQHILPHSLSHAKTTRKEINNRVETEHEAGQRRNVRVAHK